ncbi:MAG TPA: type IV pilus twitching motility protein PilT [Gemmatimonadaceae bacterium]|nr:type IV pilus twitching motility protein PilT [Gemmatimonadaceae bacterium]
MAQIDRLLSVLATHPNASLQLADNEPAVLRRDGTTQPMTRQPLAAAQLQALVREIAPADVWQQLEAGTPAEFPYKNGDGAFRARAVPESTGWHVTLIVDADIATNGAGTAASAKVTDATPRIDDASRAHIDALLTMLSSRGASDLHLRAGEPPIIRLHGEMVRVEGEPELDSEAIEKMLEAIFPARNLEEYATMSDSDFAYEIAGVARFRANALRDRKGAAAVFRVIPAKVVSVEEMAISAEVQALCQLTKGLVLVTGPTGSGKSTTLCALIDLVNRSRSDHVITIEDPIEFVHENKSCVITQRQVGLHTTSFKHALRAALREDPDIVLVGELRDLETASIAIETAETGHLVFATLHTTTAASTIDRLIDQFPPDRQEQIRVMLSESLKGVISQVLCKKVGGGRVAAREILLSTPAISNLIREAKTFQITSAMQTGRKSGMITLNDALIELVDTNVVEGREAYTKAADKVGFAAQLRARGHDTSFLDAESGAAPTPQRGQETGLNVKTPMPRPGYGTARR